MISLRGEWEVVPGWRRGSVFTPAAAAVVVLVAALAGHFAGVSWWWAAPGGVAGVLAVTATAARTRPTRGVLHHRLVCVACTASWLAVAWTGAPWPDARFPWSGDWLAVWAAGAVALGAPAVAFGRRDEAVEARRAADALHAERTERAAAWKDLVEDICHVKVAEIIAVQAWPATKTCDEPGFTVEARLDGGATWDDVKTFAPKLASKARLPYGCRITVSEGNGADLVLLDVPVHDTLKDLVRYPEDCERRSVNDDYTIAVRRNGSDYHVNTREKCIFIAGRRGGGKTTLMYVLIARGAEAVDGITCVIDLKGDLIPPWVAPHLEHRAERPAVDWPAGTVEQAIRMCDALIRVGDARAAAPENIRLKREVNSNILPLDATRPQFNLYIDEGKGITGGNVRDPRLIALAVKIETLREKYRSQGVNVYFTCLRSIATATSGTDIRVQSAIVALTQSKTEEVRNTFDDSAGLSAADIPNQGNILIADSVDRPEPVQGLFLDPQAIDRVAVKVGHPDFHPDPEPVALAALGDAWTTRWDPEEVAWLVSGTAVDTAPMGTSPEKAGGNSDPMAGVNEALADMEAIAERMRRRSAPPAEEEPGTGTPAFEDVVGAESWPQVDMPADDDARTRALGLVFDAGRKGVTALEVEAALADRGTPASRQAIHRWMKSWIVEGLVVQPRERGPYVHRDHADGHGK